MSKKSRISVELPNWWQGLIIIVVIITVLRTDADLVLELIGEFSKSALSPRVTSIFKLWYLIIYYL